VRTAWRLILGGGDGAGLCAAGGAVNMAVDQTLLESVQQQPRPVLRLYRWNPPCLSLGRNQMATGVYDAARAAAAGIDIVRRPTGGLAVLHHGEITYSVMAPLTTFGGPRAAYSAINSAIVAALREWGVPADLAPPGPVRPPHGNAAPPCFDAPAPGEIVAAGRKLVGSAQRCERRTLLQHGSLLLDGSQAIVAELMTRLAVTAGAGVDAAAAAGAGAITLRELLGTVPDTDHLIGALRHGFESTFGTRLAPDTLTLDERARVDRHAARYAAAAWTWRL
jgi:lipoyl(octanoyl) transferase